MGPMRRIARPVLSLLVAAALLVSGVAAEGPVLTWLQFSPAASPGPRHDHALAYAGNGTRFVLFSGAKDGCCNPDQETWLYSTANESWWKVNPANPPAARQDHEMTHLPTTNRVLMFGGNLWSGGNENNETWLYDAVNNTWSNAAPPAAPGKRTQFAMAYAGNGSVVLFGGDVGPGGTVTPANDTWVYDVVANNWTERTPSQSPPARRHHELAMVAPGLLVLFGGLGQSNQLDDTWLYNLSSNQWTKLNPQSKPGIREGHVLVPYENDTVLLFGGYCCSGRKGDTWRFSLATMNWTDMLPPTSPSPRYEHAMAYSPAVKRVLMYGGDTDPGGYNGETWQFVEVVIAPELNGSLLVALSVVAMALWGGRRLRTLYVRSAPGADREESPRGHERFRSMVR